MKKFISLICFLTWGIAFGNYNIGDSIDIYLTNWNRSQQIVVDVPQYYMTGKDGKNWFVGCECIRRDKSTDIPVSVNIFSKNYQPAPGAAINGDYMIHFTAIYHIFPFKFYMGSKACPVRESTFILTLKLPSGTATWGGIVRFLAIEDKPVHST